MSAAVGPTKSAPLEQLGDDVVLDIRGLSCDIDTPAGTALALQDVDLQVRRGSALGIVGESGSGKSMLLKSTFDLTPSNARVRGEVTFAGRRLASMPADEKRRFLGRRVGFVFQNPMTSLNPVVKIGRQIGEAGRYHLGLSARQAREQAVELLASVGIPDPRARIDLYPHQFSGGMRQRVMIAMALACEPELLVADEATTALDVTVQKEILDLLQRLRQDRQMTLILVSHDLGVVAGRTDDVAVMYGGRIVERAPTAALFEHHRHRYTEALLDAVPRLDHASHARLRTIPGQPPSLLDPPAGCPFAPRCSQARGECRDQMPPAFPGVSAAHVHHCLIPRGSSSWGSAVSQQGSWT